MLKILDPKINELLSVLWVFLIGLDVNYFKQNIFPLFFSVYMLVLKLMIQVFKSALIENYKIHRNLFSPKFTPEHVQF